MLVAVIVIVFIVVVANHPVVLIVYVPLQMQNKLLRPQFYLAMRMVALAQGGLPASRRSSDLHANDSSVGLPKFNAIKLPDTQTATTTTSAVSGTQSWNVADLLAMDSDDDDEFTFSSIPPVQQQPQPDPFAAAPAPAPAPAPVEVEVEVEVDPVTAAFSCMSPPPTLPTAAVPPLTIPTPTVTMEMSATELFRLRDVNVNESAITTSTTHMQSHRYICCCDTDTKTNSQHVVILSMEHSNTEALRYPIPATSAIMNPQHDIIALQQKQQLRLFNIGTRTQLRDVTIRETVGFWKWVSASTVALVTTTAVYHWDYQASAEPTQVFARHPKLNNCNIVDYQVSSNMRWCVVVAHEHDNTSAGILQIYSAEESNYRTVAGTAATFASAILPGRQNKSQLVLFTTTSTTGSMLQALELGRAGHDSWHLPVSPVTTAGLHDVPVSLHTVEQSSGDGPVVVVVSRCGVISVLDITNGKELGSKHVVQEQVVSVCIDLQPMSLLLLSSGVGALHRITISEIRQKERSNAPMPTAEAAILPAAAFAPMAAVSQATTAAAPTTAAAVLASPLTYALTDSDDDDEWEPFGK